jgi:hypothetical protein
MNEPVRHEDNEFSGTCPTCGQAYAGREIDRLRQAIVDAIEAGEDGDWQSARRGLMAALTPNAQVQPRPCCPKGGKDVALEPVVGRHGTEGEAR